MLFNVLDNVPIPNIGDVQLAMGSGIMAVIPKGAAVNLVRRKTFKDIGIFDNALGLFSVSSDVRSGKVHFLSFQPKSFGLRPRGNGCSWDPTLGVVANTDAITTYGLEGMLQQCADELMGNCFRSLLGAGVEVYNVLATPEAKQLFVETIVAIYGGISSDLSTLTYFGKHPLIASAFNNNKSGFDSEKLERFYNGNYNKDLPTGIVTILDSLKSAGVPNYTVQAINPSDVLGTVYEGDAKKLLKTLKNNSTYEMRQVLAQNPKLGIYILSRSLFERLKDQLSGVDGCCTEQGYSLLTGGGESLMFDGHVVIPADIFDLFDIGTDTTSFRAIFTTAGNFGVGFDVPGLDSDKGLGMVLQQSDRVQDKGQVFGLTSLDFGVGLIDKNYTTYASYVVAN